MQDKNNIGDYVTFCYSEYVIQRPEKTLCPAGIG